MCHEKTDLKVGFLMTRVISSASNERCFPSSLKGYFSPQAKDYIKLKFQILTIGLDFLMYYFECMKMENMAFLAPIPQVTVHLFFFSKFL